MQHTNGGSFLANVANQDPHVGLLSGAGFLGPQHHDTNYQNIEEGRTRGAVVP